MKATFLALTTVLATIIAMPLGCGAQHLVMAPSNVIPAAQIKLDLGKDANGNTTVDLKAQHLAQPANLNPPKSVYVVWVQSDDQTPERKGQLTVNKDLNGELKFVTPDQHFQLFITAEDNANTVSPAGTEVIRGSVARGR
ncbi:MAG TPA: hypothetical protein VN709_01345 [Terriglobales bacterium]|nr:hypothetical protein [Terriglobales bacterium]